MAAKILLASLFPAVMHANEADSHVYVAGSTTTLEEEALHDRIVRYCASPAFSSADEGHSPVQGAVLRQAIVLIRHGDRSAIHHVPGTDGVTFTCAKPQANDFEIAAALVNPVRSTTECRIQGGSACANITDNAAPTSGESISAFQVWQGGPRSVHEVCGPHGGELSSVGWQQHLDIGADLANVYADLVKSSDMPWSSAIDVASTDYGRTALSAAAFVSGMFNQLGLDTVAVNQSSANAQRQRQQISAATAEPEPALDAEASSSSQQLLPGLDLPIPLQIVDRLDDPMLWAKRSSVCARAHAMQMEDIHFMFGSAGTPTDIAEFIAQNAKIEESQVPGTEEIADAIYAASCHGHGLPCWSASGPAGAPADAASAAAASGSTPTRVCISQEQADRILKRGDYLYRDRFTNRATRLLTYPLLHSIVQTLQRSADRKEGSPRFALRAGHDTVISPLLATLNATDGPYAWPGYASRVIFELWEAAEQQHIVRMLFNGVDFTHRLDCAQKMPGGDSRFACTLQDFEQQIQQLIHPFVSWEEACSTPLALREKLKPAAADSQDAEPAPILASVARSIDTSGASDGALDTTGLHAAFSTLAELQAVAMLPSEEDKGAAAAVAADAALGPGTAAAIQSELP